VPGRPQSTVTVGSLAISELVVRPPALASVSSITDNRDRNCARNVLNFKSIAIDTCKNSDYLFYTE
jgi:hypothetical protein